MGAHDSGEPLAASARAGCASCPCVRYGGAQVGPVSNVHMPKDKVTSRFQGYGFVEFRSEDDAEYAIKVRTAV